MALQFKFCLVIVALGILVCAECVAQRAQLPILEPKPPIAPAGNDQPADPPSGCISGAVIDESGAVVAGAQVQVARNGQSIGQGVLTGSDGQFFLANIAPGAFDLTITASGFAPRKYSGVLQSDQIATIPPIMLSVASSVTAIEVGLTREQVAEEQIKVEEQQRVLGVIPNFYVSYDPHAVALTPKQKFRLAARTVIDPFTFVFVGGSAGVEQWQNHFVGYGQGFDGYAKRFGANYADTLTGTFIGGAILPSILKQDPRYFYKGTGSFPARFVYAIGMAVICKGDNGRWQPNYSGILGSLAAGGISNLYYPAQDRNSASLTFDNTAIGIASNAFSNLLQEFIIPKLTPHRPHPGQAQP
jgi:hypothetical protein